MSQIESQATVVADESMTILHNVTSLSDDISMQEQLKIICKPTYRMRRLRNRGAIMLLVWNYLIASIYFFDVTLLDIKHYQNFGVLFTLQMAAGGLTLPIAGWLADVYIGRYKVIRCSMWVMWIFCMLVSANAVLDQLVERYNVISYVVHNILMFIGVVALAAFQANIIQFGMDQLHDATTDEIASFIIWYVWSFYATGLVAQLTFRCVPTEYMVLGMLIVCIYLSLAMCLMLLFNSVLVKEPVTQNPFKLVYSVIRFAMKNKTPPFRSAFTYCEDELPSRIDFGKIKYGGPFTTEQVDDVKTFLRLLSIIAIVSLAFGEHSASDSLIHKVFWMLSVNKGGEGQCYSKQSFVYLSEYSWVFVLPIYELIVYPTLRRFLVNIKTQTLLVLGALLLTLNVLSLAAIEIMARRHYFESNLNATSVQCADIGTFSTSLDYRWMALPYVLRSVSVTLLSIGSIRLIVAQTPYSMRGLIMGAGYGLLFLSCALGITISYPFIRNLSVWGTGIISCGLWHALLIVIIETLAVVALCLIFKKCGRRKREDVLPNEHIFAERYYDRDS